MIENAGPDRPESQCNLRPNWTSTIFANLRRAWERKYKKKHRFFLRRDRNLSWPLSAILYQKILQSHQFPSCRNNIKSAPFGLNFLPVNYLTPYYYGPDIQYLNDRVCN